MLTNCNYSMFFFCLYCRSEPTSTEVVIYLKNRTEKNETAVFAIITD